MLTADRLRELFEYRPLEGVFVRRVSACPRVKIGDVAGAANTSGHIQIRVDGRLYLAHRLAWLYMRGCWPERTLDHRNGRHGDNRWHNLREATQSQNGGNMKRPKSNTSGFKGVSWNATEKRYRAQISLGGRKVTIGRYHTPEAAHAAYAAKAIELYGEFARAG